MERKVYLTGRATEKILGISNNLCSKKVDAEPYK